jgi:poly(A) polymerase
MKTVSRLARAKWLKAPALCAVFDTVAHAGGEARVVGGAVRNALMGLPIADIDLATTLQPEQAMAAFKAKGYGVVPTGITHGTITAIVDHRPFEITTLRRDVETDGRRAKVAFTDDWREDALRRDFTINALYCDPAGKIYDYSAGYEDIRRKRITFVGNPAQRIAEDHLRILRFFRFLSAYQGAKPDRLSLTACIRGRKKLVTLSSERVSKEMLKLLAGPEAVPVLRLMARHGVLKIVLPHTEQLRLLARVPPDPILRAFVLAERPSELQQRWRLSNAQAKRLEALADAPPLTPGLRPRERKRICYMLGAEGWRDSVDLSWARSKAPLDDRAWRALRGVPKRWDMPQFPVTGADLIKAGLKPGPAMGRVLQELKDRWIAADFKLDRDRLLAEAEGAGHG